MRGIIKFLAIGAPLFGLFQLPVTIGAMIAHSAYHEPARPPPPPSPPVHWTGNETIINSGDGNPFWNGFSELGRCGKDSWIVQYNGHKYTGNGKDGYVMAGKDADFTSLCSG